MNKNIELAFKKMLGKGHAWRAIATVTSELLDVFISPLVDVFTYFKNLKYVHFPVTYVNESNIINGEDLFGVTEIQNKTLEERAANVEGQWTALAGSQTFKQIEQILQKKGIPVRIIEDIPNTYNKYGARKIGNGLLQLESGIKDPIIITNSKHTFVIQSTDFLNEEQIKTLVDTVVKFKPMHNGAYYIPRFLRKKEIHHVLTKSQMQTYRKCQYCDVRTPGKF